MSEPKRIVLLGKTGSGKSSLGNTIFGETLFRVNRTSRSGTKECRAETKFVNGRRITFIDTPGFFDTNKSEQDLKSEIIKCITECAPGPHAFLIVLKVERFTECERDVIKKIQEYFSEEVFKYATVVFIHGDQLQEGQTIEELVHEYENLRELVKKCGGRCHVFDNKYWKEKPMNEYKSNKFQVEQLLKTIDRMIEENKGGYYSNEMLQAVEEKIQRKKTIFRRLPGHMSEEEINPWAKKNVCKKPLSTLAGRGTEPKRIVLLGKTGSGKSSLANTVFGETMFEVKTSPKSVTKVCRAETRFVNGRNITLIDTPGFFDTNKSEQDLKPEIIKCLIECAPGPHAFLIVLKVDRYTEEERAVIKKIPESFSEEVFKYATVVFTRGDDLQEGQTIEEFVREDENLSELVKKCGGRCHVIDNKYWKEKPMDEYRSNKFQVEQLLKTIDKMIEENNDGYYSNEMLQAVEEKIQREREIIRQSAGNLSEEEINERATENVLHQLLIALAGIGTGAIIGAFFGVKILIKLVLRAEKQISTLVKDVKKLKVAAGAALGGAAAKGAVRRGAVGGAVGGTASGGAAMGGAAAGGGEAVGGAAVGGGGTALVLKGAAACVGTSALVGASVGGYEGFKAAMEAETVWEAIKMAAKAVTEGGTNICDMIDDWGQNSN